MCKAVADDAGENSRVHCASDVKLSKLSWQIVRVTCDKATLFTDYAIVLKIWSSRVTKKDCSVQRRGKSP